MFTLFFLAVSLIGAFIHLLVQRRLRTGACVVEVFLLWMLAVTVGVEGIVFFAGHAFQANAVARQIGWPTGSPFQFEIAIANLSYGVLGLLCIWIRGNFWYATGIGNAIFYLGDAYGHVVQIVRYHDYAPYNSGLFLFCEILIALLLIVLLLAHKLLSVRKQVEKQLVY